MEFKFESVKQAQETINRISSYETKTLYEKQLLKLAIDFVHGSNKKQKTIKKIEKEKDTSDS